MLIFVISYLNFIFITTIYTFQTIHSIANENKENNSTNNISRKYISCTGQSRKWTVEPFLTNNYPIPPSESNGRPLLKLQQIAMTWRSACMHDTSICVPP